MPGVQAPPTHVDEIAAHIAKRFKEVSIIKLRESAAKCVSPDSVKPGVCLIEKSS
jgi:hypothetical protein